MRHDPRPRQPCTPLLRRRHRSPAGRIVRRGPRTCGASSATYAVLTITACRSSLTKHRPTTRSTGLLTGLKARASS